MAHHPLMHQKQLSSDVRTAPSRSVPWTSENDWSFKSLQLEGSELSRSMKQVHQVPINTYDRGQTVFLRQQKTTTAWVREAHVHHATAKTPVNIAWKGTAHSYTTCLSSLWLLSILWRWKRQQWALHDLAFLTHGAAIAPLEMCCLPNPECSKRTLHSAHIGSPLH